ncbi:hypothetical protein NPIL_541571 [Nephila pilipes]|uniref:SAM-dependent methyltransferase TRM5/TYW2-type domain-containing protein n=1 Tax=Nephila pilipes TaxID=299642 RepID=A0A8X6NU19_NEPPI|nr:hypothetical protein NPIL_541571 [Nephila pilipes]
MSVEIQTPSVRWLSIFPPHTVCGMKVLDRDAFRKEITVPSIFVTVDKVGEVIKLIKQNDCLLKMDNLQPVQDEGKDKIILLDPDSYEEKYLKIRQCFKKVDINSVSWRKITVTYENWNSQDIFKAILPPNTPGNISVKERERIFRTIDSGDLVYDVFAGVGPFAIPLAKQKCQVHANDLNPDSYKWLCHNANLNKVTQYVRAYNLDGKEFIQTIVKIGLVDFWMRDEDNRRVHVLMNLPACALDFLETFKGLFSEYLPKVGVMPIINCYFFKKEDEDMNDIIDKYFDDEAQKTLKISVVRAVAPNKLMFRATYKLTKKTLFLHLAL